MTPGGSSFSLKVMLISRKILRTSIALYLFCQIFFLVNIQFPRGANFDEFHYVPSAKQFLQLIPNQNWEHPPLGKLLMAVGIALWGDRPIGWRFMSTVFGSITLVGVYFLGWVIFENESIALWIALITLCNQLLYVQSRIGMLDTFMIGFLIWGMVSFCATWNPRLSVQTIRKYLLFTGLMLGLSMACKWFAFVPWAAIVALISLVRLMQKWQLTFGNPKEEDWYSPQLWHGIRWTTWLNSFVLVPFGVYFLTFIPFFFIAGGPSSLGDLLEMQYRMWDGQLRVVTSHPYMSRWIDWPLITRPIWYAFDREGAGQAWVRGVLMIGNPLIMWSGLMALLLCAWEWIQTRNRKAFFILFFYSVYYICWIVIPRKISFYYYYYPSAIMLSFALAYVFFNKKYQKKLNLEGARWIFFAAALGMFVYFFPILAALKIPADSFRNWMWFQSWI